MSRCIYKNQEFYKLAKDSNLSEFTLELIIYQYWKDTNKGDFPSIEYIDSFLGRNQTYSESVPEVVEVWENFYKYDLVFSDASEYEQAVKEAYKYFPKTSVVGYLDALGNYVLKVIRPKQSYLKRVGSILSEGQNGISERIGYSLGEIIKDAEIDVIIKEKINSTNLTAAELMTRKDLKHIKELYQLVGKFWNNGWSERVNKAKTVEEVYQIVEEETQKLMDDLSLKKAHTTTERALFYFSHLVTTNQPMAEDMASAAGIAAPIVNTSYDLILKKILAEHPEMERLEAERIAEVQFKNAVTEQYSEEDIEKLVSIRNQHLQKSRELILNQWVLALGGYSKEIQYLVYNGLLGFYRKQTEANVAAVFKPALDATIDLFLNSTNPQDFNFYKNYLNQAKLYVEGEDHSAVIRYNVNKDEALESVKRNAIGNISNFSIQDSTILGYTRNGKIVLSKEGLNPNTPVHEYTHLWDKAIQAKYPELWKKGKDLMKKLGIWQEVINDHNYTDIVHDEDLVASEVHSRLTGQRSEEILLKEVDRGLVGKIKEWIKEVFKKLSRILSDAGFDMKKVNEMSDAEFMQFWVEGVIGDLMEGFNPNKYANTNGVAEYSVKAIDRSAYSYKQVLKERYRRQLREKMHDQLYNQAVLMHERMLNILKLRKKDEYETPERAEDSMTKLLKNAGEGVKTVHRIRANRRGYFISTFTPKSVNELYNEYMNKYLNEQLKDLDMTEEEAMSELIRLLSEDDLDTFEEPTLQRKLTVPNKATESVDAALDDKQREAVIKNILEYRDSHKGDYHDVVREYFTRNNTTARDILTDIIGNTENESLRQLALKALDAIGDTEVSVIYEDVDTDANGQFFYNEKGGYIKIYRGATQGKSYEQAKEALEGTLLHEIIHAITVDKIMNNPKLAAKITSIVLDLNTCLVTNRITPINAGKNAYEFVAEFLSKPVFREALKHIKADKSRTIWQRVLDFIKSCLGIDRKTKLFDVADKTIDKLLLTLVSSMTQDAYTYTFNEPAQLHTFTLNGITTNTPFKLNSLQEGALAALDEFIKDYDANMFTLEGFAGTGKTSIMEIFAERQLKKGSYRGIVFTATTHKASGVLKSKVKPKGFNATTMHKIFGIRVENTSTKEYDARSTRNILFAPKVEGGTIVIIDEASMLNESQYNIVKLLAEYIDLKVIFMGDPALLSPVNSTKMSPVFQPDKVNKIYRLDKVERTGDNAILREATALRNGKNLSGKTEFNSKGQGVAYIPSSNRKLVRALISSHLDDVRQGPDNFVILAYENATVLYWNRYVREALGFVGNIPLVGEILMGYTNVEDDENMLLVNGECYQVIKATEVKKKNVNIPTENGYESITLYITELTIKDSYGKETVIPYTDVVGTPENIVASRAIVRSKEYLLKLINLAIARKDWREKNRLRKEQEHLDNIAVFNRNIEVDKKLKIPKGIDFGYSYTIHKSQGSTIKHVVIDYKGLDDVRGITPEEREASRRNNQELKYVAVSRATDTVTVLYPDAEDGSNPVSEDPAFTGGGTQDSALFDATSLFRTETTPPPTVGAEGNRAVPIDYTIDGKTNKYYVVNKDGKLIITDTDSNEVFKGNNRHKTLILLLYGMLLNKVVKVSVDGTEYYVNLKGEIRSSKYGRVVHPLNAPIIYSLAKNLFSSKGVQFNIPTAENNAPVEIKPEYKGKLIFAQTGTGKTRLADNVNIIDSDVIWAELIGATVDTMTDVWRTLTAEEKTEAIEKYKLRINDLIALGKTVVTGLKSLLQEKPEAFALIVYNESAEETNRRTSDPSRLNSYNDIEATKTGYALIEAIALKYPEKAVKLTDKLYLSDVICTEKSAKDVTRVEVPATPQPVPGELFITGNSRTTKEVAALIGGIDTLRHPDVNGMHFGNPFSHNPAWDVEGKKRTVKEATYAFEDWLLGRAHQEIEPARRIWIMNQILSGKLVGKVLVYYTTDIARGDTSYGKDVTKFNKDTAPCHAHILLRLIERFNPNRPLMISLENTFAIVNTLGTFSEQYIEKDDNHIYYVNGLTIDYSVTFLVGTESLEKASLRKQLMDSARNPDKYGNEGYLRISGVLGSIYDEVGRDIFSGEDISTKNYPNLRDSDKQKLAEQLTEIKNNIINSHTVNGVPPIFITKDNLLQLVGNVNTTAGVKSLAGTIDMLVIDGAGYIHIYDFKTKRVNNGTDLDTYTLNKYGEQIYLYQRLMEVMFPDLKGLFKGRYLIQMNLSYDDPTYNSKIRGIQYRILKNAKGLEYVAVKVPGTDKLIELTDASDRALPLGRYKFEGVEGIIDVSNRATSVWADCITLYQMSIRYHKLSGVSPFRSYTNTSTFDISATTAKGNIGSNKFSPVNATFQGTTTIDGMDVTGKSIQDIVNSRVNAYPCTPIEKYDLYYKLWEEWVQLNPSLTNELALIMLSKRIICENNELMKVSAIALQDVLKGIKRKTLDTSYSAQGRRSYSGHSLGTKTVENPTISDNIANEFGILGQQRYSAQDYDSFTEEEKKEAEKYYKEALDIMGVPNSYIDDNNEQGKAARAIYKSLRDSDALYTNGKWGISGKLEGPAKMHVAMAIAMNKRVYMFNLGLGQWGMYTKNDTFTPINESSSLSLLPKHSIIDNIDSEDSEDTVTLYENAIRQLFENTSKLLDKPLPDKGSLRATVTAHNAIIDAFGNTIDTHVGISEAVLAAKRGKDYESIEAFFSSEEQSLIRLHLNKGPLKVLSASRHTDVAFFEKEIISLLLENSKKALSDPSRILCIEIWSKHDGIPMVNILEACKKYRVAPVVQFSITGLGDTILEKGVLKYTDMLDKVEELILKGYINPNTTSIRIDPILVGVTNYNDIRNIVKRGTAMGIKHFITSMVLSYGYTSGDNDRHVISGINEAMAKEGKTYDWEKYYGTITDEDVNEYGKWITSYTRQLQSQGVQVTPKMQQEGALKAGIRVAYSNSRGCIHHFPKQLYIDEYGAVLQLICAECPDAVIETCAFFINGFNTSACLDALVLEKLLGTAIKDKDVEDESRGGCYCFKNHQDMFQSYPKCKSACVYCYGRSVKDSRGALQYYDDNGNIIDSPYVRVESTFDKDYKSMSDLVPEQVRGLVEHSRKKKPKFSSEVLHFIDGNVALKLKFDTIFSKSYEYGYSTLDVYNFANNVAYTLNNFLEECLKDPDIVLELFGIRIDPSISKLKLIKKIGIPQLLNEIKNLYEVMEYNDPKIENFITDIILPNWEAIEKLSAGMIQRLLGFTLTTREINKAEEIEDSSKELGTALQDWLTLYETKTIEWGMTDLVRSTLFNIRDVDNSGEEILDNLGGFKHKNPTEIIQNVVRWVRGSISSVSMLSKLEKLVDRHPWVLQLIDILKNPENSTFRSLFFSICRRCSVKYSVTQVKDKKNNIYYNSKIVNTNTVRKNLLLYVKYQYILNAHPILGTKSINDENLDKFKEYKEELDNLLKGFVNGQPLTLLQLEKAVKLVNALNVLLCVEVPLDTLQSILNPVLIKVLADKAHELYWAFKKLQTLEDYETTDHFYYTTDFMKNLTAYILGFAEELELSIDTSVSQDGKLYSSDLIPSWLLSTVEFIKGDYGTFEREVLNQYKESEWFFNKDWMHVWMGLLAGDTTGNGARAVFDHKVELNANKKQYMQNMSPIEYTLSILSNFWAEYNPKKLSSGVASRIPAWFRVPIMSNYKSSEYIKFYAEMGPGYKNTLLKYFWLVFLQEAMRIRTCRNRAEYTEDHIESFDENGLNFCFLDFMNQYFNDGIPDLITLDLIDAYIEWYEAPIQYTNLQGDTVVITTDKKANNHLKLLLNTWLESGREEITAEMLKALKELFILAMEANMNNKFNDQLAEWENQGINTKTLENITMNGVDFKGDNFRKNLEIFFWNDAFAATLILLMTVVDIAFYKNVEDLQKRLAQLHSPGMRGDISVVDPKTGEGVTDGKHRSIIFSDRFIVSNIIDNVSEVLQRQIDSEKDAGRKEILIAHKDFLVGESGLFRKVNVADAQAYLSLDTYKKTSIMFGKWDNVKEEVYTRMTEAKDKGNIPNIKELEVTFPALKPFVYSLVNKSIGVGNSPIKTLPIPTQYKNSEYLLFMASAILEGQSTSKPNILKVMNDIMQRSSKIFGTKACLDCILFESAVKSGKSHVIDINNYMESSYNEKGELVKQWEESDIVEDICSKLWTTDLKGNSVYNIGTYVTEIPYRDYAIQLNIPDHFMDGKNQVGSQIRALGFSMIKNFNNDGTPTIYRFTDRFGDVLEMNGLDFRKEYERVLHQCIEMNIKALKEEFKLDGTEVEKNVALAKLLQSEIDKNPLKYGVELINGCLLNKNGEFNIPINDFTNAIRILLLINSIIKNRINKQMIAGGPVVQVSSFGISKNLNIRFKSKNGETLYTWLEYKKKNPKHSIEDFKKYIEKNQGAIDCFEVYISPFSEALVDNFADENGYIDVEKVREVNPELLEMIGYRIPTEDAYSCAPIKVVGFLPAHTGDVIMLPEEITLLSGSDFDIDKLYILRKDFKILRDDKNALQNRLIQNAQRAGKEKSIKSLIRNELLLELKASNEQLSKDEFNKEIRDRLFNLVKEYTTAKKKRKAFKHSDHDYFKYLDSIYDVEKGKVEYITEAKDERTQLNNQLVSMLTTILTHESITSDILNPGGFENISRWGHTSELIRNYKGMTIERCEKASLKDLKKAAHTDRNLIYIGTLQAFYKQNATAGKLIGIFAVHRSAHAFLENDNIFIDLNDIFRENSLSAIGTGIRLTGKIKVDPILDLYGNNIGKILGSFVASSVDAVKDPVLNLLNINEDSARILMTMVRLGIPAENACYLLASKIFKEIVDEYNKLSILEEFVRFSEILYTKLKNYEEETSKDTLNTEDITKEELEYAIANSSVSDKKSKKINYKILNAISKFLTLSECISAITLPTRQNSITAAVGPKISDSFITESKLLNNELYDFYAADTIQTNSEIQSNDLEGCSASYLFHIHPILNSFFKGYDIAKEIMKDMTEYTNSFKNVLGYIPYKVLSKKGFLPTFINFYKSRILIKAGVFDSSQASWYQNKFPKYLMKEKEKYPDNFLLQRCSVIFNEPKSLNIVQLNKSIDGSEDEKIRQSWKDLYYKDKDLAYKLFTYNFFLGGIGFNPLTFIHLVPNIIKTSFPGYISAITSDLEMDTTELLTEFYRYPDNSKFAPFIKNKIINKEYVVLTPLDKKIYGNVIRVMNGITKKVDLYVASLDPVLNSVVYKLTSKYGDSVTMGTGSFVFTEHLEDNIDFMGEENIDIVENKHIVPNRILTLNAFENTLLFISVEIAPSLSYSEQKDLLMKSLDIRSSKNKILMTLINNLRSIGIDANIDNIVEMLEKYC